MVLMGSPPTGPTTKMAPTPSWWPDVVYDVMPALGLLLVTPSLVYVCMMRKRTSGVYLVLYVSHVFDLLLGLSLVIAGFHGILVSVHSANSADEQTPLFRCVFEAPYLPVWWFVDVGRLLLLLLLAADQFVSVMWSKVHKQITLATFLLTLATFLPLFTSAAALIPAELQSIALIGNTTVRVSAFCWLEDVVGRDVYAIDIEIRKWTPILAIGVLGVTIIALLCFQLLQSCSFKWSDNNADSTRHFFLTLARALLLAAAVHVPLRWHAAHIAAQHPALRPMRELGIRLADAALFGIVQPPLCVWLISAYRSRLAHFMNLVEHRRGWQSVNDPPTRSTLRVGGSVNQSGRWHRLFGSFMSTTGNIVGEAGIPYEISGSIGADEAKSISFYYKS